MADLSRLFKPRHIAVFGGAWAHNVIAQLQKTGFAGEIWPVHPKKTEVAGLKTYRDVSDLPEAPDASFIGVNRNLTPQILGALSQMGAGGAVCFASGFAETSADDETVTSAGEASGSDLQAQALAAAGDMPFLGPNCYGFVNYLEKVALWPDEHGGVAQSSGVGIITQSSNMAITLSMSKRALPLAVLATAGNQAQLDMCDIGDALLEDGRITALGLHIEGIASLPKLEALAKKARDKRIPIIALKVGKSEAAQQATLSHTASLAGSDDSAGALLKRLGIARVSGLGSFVEALKLADSIGALNDYTIGSLSCSGGEASLIADCASATSLRFPDLHEAQKQSLAEALGPLVHLSNPLDYQTYIWGNDAVMTQTFAAMMTGDQALTCLVLDPPRTDRCDDSPWTPARDCLIKAKEITGGKAVMISTLPETLSEDFSAPSCAAGITALMGLEDGLAAIEAMADIGAAWAKEPPLEMAPRAFDTAKDADATIGGALQMLSEDDAKAMLAKAGIDVPKRVVAIKQDDAITSLRAADLQFPLVVKGMGFAHKTEAGAVALHITDEAMLGDVMARMAAPEGYLIEEMITGGVLELLVGIVSDPAHGPVLTIAEGGIYTELLQDKVTISLPARARDIQDALQSLRCWPKALGYRGQKGCDIDKLISLIQSVSQLYEQSVGAIVEIEMNPVIATPHRAVAVDALVTQKEA